MSISLASEPSVWIGPAKYTYSVGAEGALLTVQTVRPHACASLKPVTARITNLLADSAVAAGGVTAYQSMANVGIHRWDRNCSPVNTQRSVPIDSEPSPEP